jgi:hypothetical protein
LNKFQGLHSTPLLEQHPQAGGEVLLSCSHFTPAGDQSKIFVGEGSIEKHLLSRKSHGNKRTIITGRTFAGD